MAVNKVVLNDAVELDLTEDTVTPQTLAKGVTAHNAAGELIVGEMEAGSAVKQYTGTLLSDGWAEDSYGYQAQTITIEGLAAEYAVDPQWDVALSGTDPDADAALLEGFALIHNYQTGENSLTAQCIGDAPSVNIPVKVVVFG